MAKVYYAKKSFSYGIYSYRVGDEVSADRFDKDTLETFIKMGILTDKPIKDGVSNQKGLDEFGVPLDKIEDDNEKITTRSGIKPPATDGEILGKIDDDTKKEEPQENQEEAQKDTSATDIAEDTEENKENTEESQEEAQEEVNLDNMTKKEIIEYAKAHNIELPKNAMKLSKDKLKELVRGDS